MKSCYDRLFIAVRCLRIYIWTPFIFLVFFHQTGPKGQITIASCGWSVLWLQGNNGDEINLRSKRQEEHDPQWNSPHTITKEDTVALQKGNEPVPELPSHLACLLPKQRTGNCHSLTWKTNGPFLAIFLSFIKPAALSELSLVCSLCFRSNDKIGSLVSRSFPQVHQKSQQGTKAVIGITGDMNIDIAICTPKWL